MDGNISMAQFIQETDKIYSRLNSHESKIAVLETVIRNFEGLPTAIQSLEKTMILMQANLEELNKKVDTIVMNEQEVERRNRKFNETQNKKIEEISNNSKIDIIAFIKSKWLEIVMFAAMAVLLLEDKISR